MTDIPIIMSAPMVLALLAGRKTMTRRLAWRLSDVHDNHTRSPSSWQRVKPGDRLWVRENCEAQKYQILTSRRAIYCAGGEPVIPFSPLRIAQEPWEYRYDTMPSIHMPRAYSRLTLMVTATKIERLQDITEADAKAEGVQQKTADFVSVRIPGMWFGDPAIASDTPQQAFASLWVMLHDRDAWNENPEVVALAFTVHQKNIDAMEKAA